MQPKQFPPRHVDPTANIHETHNKEDEEDEEEEFDLLDVMKSMSFHERRKVYAMKGLLNDYKTTRTKFREELALLQIEHLKATQRLHDIRKEVVCGVREITAEEIAALSKKEASGVEEVPTDEEAEVETKKPAKVVNIVAPKEERSVLEAAAAAPDGGIPDFWLVALCNTEVFDSMITERDRKALHYLKDITMEYVEGDPQKGVKLNFHFAPNKFFKNEVLSKTYLMSFDEDSGEMEIDSMDASPIEWTAPENNLTVTIKTKRQRHKTREEVRLIKREEKCPSFFNFFTNPLSDENDDAQDEDDEDDEEEEAELHIEAGQLLMEEIIPKAAFYYTGKSVEQVANALHAQLNFMINSDDDEEEEEEEEEEEVPPPTRRGGRGGAARGGARGGGRGGPQQQQECKQQ